MHGSPRDGGSPEAVGLYLKNKVAYSDQFFRQTTEITEDTENFISKPLINVLSVLFVSSVVKKSKQLYFIKLLNRSIFLPLKRIPCLIVS